MPGFDFEKCWNCDRKDCELIVRLYGVSPVLLADSQAVAVMDGEKSLDDAARFMQYSKAMDASGFTIRRTIEEMTKNGCRHSPEEMERILNDSRAFYETNPPNIDISKLEPK